MILLTSHERMIARRYLRPGRSEAFIFLVGIVSLIAVTLGVAALVIVMSVMNGFRDQLLTTVVGLNGQAQIARTDGRPLDWRELAERAAALPGVVRTTPVAEQRLMASLDGRIAAVVVRGMPIADADELRQGVVLGSLDDLVPGSGRVAIGTDLAQRLGAYVGSTLSLVAVEHSAEGIFPETTAHRVAAIFEVGEYDYDSSFVVMTLVDAQQLLELGDGATKIEIGTVNSEEVGAILAPLRASIADPEVQVLDWQVMNAELFGALKIDRVVTFIILSLIILVAGFNILSSLIMLVRVKTRDIAILRTMGATRTSLIRIFVAIGTVVGAIGIAAGVALGLVAVFYRQQVIALVSAVTGRGVRDPSLSYLVELPATVDPAQVLGIAGMALLFCLLATLYPAYKAASTDPVAVLRYE